MRQQRMLTYTDAARIPAECVAQANERSFAISVAVVDAGGFVWQVQRMDGAGLQTPDSGAEGQDGGTGANREWVA